MGEDFQIYFLDLLVCFTSLCLVWIFSFASTNKQQDLGPRAGTLEDDESPTLWHLVWKWL